MFVSPSNNHSAKWLFTLGTTVVAVLAVLMAGMWWTRSPAPVTTGPLQVLPGSVVAAAAVSTAPNGWQQMNVRSLFAGGVENPVRDVVAQAGLPQDPAALAALQQWVGPRLALGWLPAGINTTGGVVVAAEVAHEELAKTWTTTYLPSEKYAYTFRTVNDVQSLLVAPANYADALHGQDLSQTAAQSLGALDGSALAVVWADMEKVSQPALAAVPLLTPFVSAGLLGEGTTGVVAGSITAEDQLWKVKGQLFAVKTGGVPIAGSPGDLTSVVRTPKDTLVAAAVNDPARFAGSGLLSSRWAQISDEVGVAWPNQVSTLTGKSLVVAVGPDTDTVKQLGWISSGSDAAKSQALATRFLEPNTSITWTVTNTGTGTVVASTTAWAAQLAVPTRGRMLEDEAHVSDVVPGAQNASIVVILNSGQFTGEFWWQAFDTVGLVVSGAANDQGDADFEITAVPAKESAT